MTSAVTRPPAMSTLSALTVAIEAELDEFGEPVVEPWVAALRRLAERTLQAVPTQMVATDWVRLPPVGGSVTVGVARR